MSLKTLWKVTEECESVDYVWAEDEGVALGLADCSNAQILDRYAHEVTPESLEFGAQSERTRLVWTGTEYKSVEQLAELCTAEALEERERQERERAEWEAHPKLPI